MLLKGRKSLKTLPLHSTSANVMELAMHLTKEEIEIGLCLILCMVAKYESASDFL